jgi:hypothetical protein
MAKFSLYETIMKHIDQLVYALHMGRQYDPGTNADFNSDNEYLIHRKIHYTVPVDTLKERHLAVFWECRDYAASHGIDLTIEEVP